MGYQWFQFTRGQQEKVLRKHAFYVRHIKTKILPPFRDIEKLTDEELAIWEDENKYRYDDSEILGEMQGEFYEGFAILQRQLLLDAVAGMYVEWNKQILTWLDEQFPRLLSTRYPTIDQLKASDVIANLSFNRLPTILKLMDVPFEGTQTHTELARMSLIVNTYKHGRGHSFKKLIDEYPEHFQPRIRRLTESNVDVKDELHRYGDAWILNRFPLTVTERDLDSFDTAITCFWRSMPMGCWGAAIDVDTILYELKLAKTPTE